ncbi:TolC family protein [Thalassotalea agarivorans]|uniref:Outer membrane protein TolC n=1 Tax=Thalassotalea agarivorans TaxID=349064 RepID=A0A1I0GD19_THASX|nr:TolC family protein [Thalassotalea agarivorans]SET67931.1 Outer membrane protein TolC [Thalassotalea agarivorans]
MYRPGLSFVFFVACAFASKAHSEMLSFQQAWQMVLQHNDALAAERANIERATNVEDAFSDLNLPTVSLNAAFTRLDRDVQVKPSDLIASMPIADVNAGLGIDVDNLDGLFTSTLTERDFFTSSVTALWPIYTGGKISAAQDIASQQTLEASYLYELKKQKSFQDLTKFYYAVVLSEQILQTKQAYEDGLAKHLDNAQKMEEQGQLAKVERLQAEVSYDRAKVARQKSQKDLEIAHIALTKLVKSESTVEPTSALFINETLPEMSAFKQKTVEHYPGLKIIEAKEAQANSVIEIEKGKYHPEVFFFGNYNLYEEDNFASEILPDWEIGVGIKVPILDTSGRSGKKKAAYSQVMQARYLKAQAKSDLTVLVEKVYMEAEQSLEEYNGLASSLALAEENLKLREKAFAQGLSTSLSVVDAHIYLASIRSERLYAAYKYVVSLSELVSVSGEIQAFSRLQNEQGVPVN